MAATIWKGTLTIGAKLEVPVKFHAAVEDADVHFHLLHKPDLERVKQVMVSTATGKPVPNDEIRRGFEVAKNTYVMVEKEDLEAIEPEESREIHVENFVPDEAINHQWYERPYYLSPDGRDTDYAALAAILAEERLEGVCRWVMRKRPQVGSLQSVGGFLVMTMLHHADEVIAVEDLPQPAGRGFSEKELKLAGQLVDALYGKFDPAAYRNEYQKRLLDFVRAKAKGKAPKLKLVRAKKSTPASDLADVLAASMRAVRKERASA